MTLPKQLILCFVLCFPTMLSSLACYANGQSKEQTDPGRTALQHGDYLSAETLYRQALRETPGSPELLTDLGIALQLQGRSSDAVHVFEQALKLKNLPRTYALLAEEKCKIRDWDGARPMLKRIIRDYAGDAKTIAVVASCYLDLDEPVDSVRAYTVLLGDESYPHDLALIQLSKSYLAAAQYFVGKLKERTDGKPYVIGARAGEHLRRSAQRLPDGATRVAEFSCRSRIRGRSCAQASASRRSSSPLSTGCNYPENRA